MAKVIIDGIEYEVKDGDLIAGPCEQAGVPFNCNSGVCGSCIVKVLEGAQNLGELSQEETVYELNKDTRLACVCVIKSGTVKLTF